MRLATIRRSNSIVHFYARRLGIPCPAWTYDKNGNMLKKHVHLPLNIVAWFRP